MPALDTRGLSVGYDGKAVLEHVDLSLEAGESVALLGPNGSGKTTLLKVFSKTLAPIAGSVRLGGRAIEEMSFAEVARAVAFVPQEEPAQFPFRVRDIVTLGRLPHAKGLMDTPEDREHATEAMRLADCLHLEARAVTELSGGERQRVLIARALAQQSQVMLFDEPTSHLDVGHQLTTARLAKRLASEGRALICAVHDLNLASLMATRAVVLASGKVGLDAPIEEALESTLLDEVYQVKFARVTLPDGRLGLLPSP